VCGTIRLTHLHIDRSSITEHRAGPVRMIRAMEEHVPDMMHRLLISGALCLQLRSFDAQ
jgi:hypothetical protein